jgi:putative ABC transport system substrate-binding protein
MKRREFITLLGGAAAWPLAAHAQQPAMPVVGFLGITSPDTVAERLRGFRQGLAEAGYVEGDNATIVYRWAENQLDRVPELAAELICRHVAVILAGGSTAAIFAAKAPIATVPLIFIVADDPVRLGLVASLARPGANLTAVNFFNTELAAKQLELLHELVPKAARVALFVNPANAPNAESIERAALPAARARGLELQILRVSTNREIDTAFETLAREPADAVFVGSDGFPASRRVQFVQQHGGRRHARRNSVSVTTKREECNEESRHCCGCGPVRFSDGGQRPKLAATVAQRALPLEMGRRG